MKKQFIISFLVMFGFVLMCSMTSAYAEKVSVSIPEGSAVQGCEETDECYIPSKIIVHPRDEVIWTNDDTAAHTVTSGTPEGGPDGIFDSSLFMAGNTFSYTFDTLGEYSYFCMVHPWMTGSVFVTVGGGLKTDLGTITIGEDKPTETVVNGLSNDGKVRVEIITGKPTINEQLSIDIRFRDSSGGGLKQHANYDIQVTQNDNVVLSETGAHEHEGEGNHLTDPLDSEDPVDIQVTLLGFGLPDDEPNWSGPKGEVMTFSVVPEFGTITLIVLGIAILSIVALTTKSKVVPKV